MVMLADKRLFPLGDNPTWTEIRALGFENKELHSARALCHPHRDGEFIQAVYTKEHRPPKKGEWYLSGAIVCAYKAPNDFSEDMVYRIAKLVRVRRETVTTVMVVE